MTPTPRTTKTPGRTRARGLGHGLIATLALVLLAGLAGPAQASSHRKHRPVVRAAHIAATSADVSWSLAPRGRLFRVIYSTNRNLAGAHRILASGHSMRLRNLKPAHRYYVKVRSLQRPSNKRGVRQRSTGIHSFITRSSGTNSVFVNRGGSSNTPPSGQGLNPNGPGGAWRLMFQDEFSGTSVNWNKWADSSSAEADGGHGNKGNQQLEWNQGRNCGVANGLLTITAKPDNITSPSGQRYNWSSCLITTTPSYAFRNGYMEIRAKFPSAKGFWPAFWTWQANGNNQWTETDVYEYYSDNASRLYLSQHSGSGGGCILANIAFNPSQGFHTYGADIKPSGGTDFYVDGRKVCSASGTHTGMTNIIVDMFVYSQIPPAPGTVATKQVDYVRAWQR